MLSVLRVTVVLAVVGFSQAALSDEYQNTVDLSETYTMYWTHDIKTSTMSFAVRAKTTGWVGFGFANKIDNMKGYDVAVGYVMTTPSVSLELKDFHTEGYRSPLIDSKQDLSNTAGSETGGYTILRFRRLVDTKDSDDIAIKPGPMIVVWSYSSVDDVTKKHVAKGYKTVTFITGAASTAHVSWVILLTTLAFAYLFS